MSDWIKACSVDHLTEGQMLSLEHNNKKILLVNQGGNISAVDLICTHAQAELSNGFLTDEGIRCPLHLSVFDLKNGMPQNPPAEKSLQTYNIKIEQDEIYVEV